MKEEFRQAASFPMEYNSIIRHKNDGKVTKKLNPKRIFIDAREESLYNIGVKFDETEHFHEQS